jgi:hypothetical protein
MHIYNVLSCLRDIIVTTTVPLATRDIPTTIYLFINECVSHCSKTKSSPFVKKWYYGFIMHVTSPNSCNM